MAHLLVLQLIVSCFIPPFINVFDSLLKSKIYACCFSSILIGGIYCLCPSFFISLFRLDEKEYVLVVMSRVASFIVIVESIYAFVKYFLRPINIGQVCGSFDNYNALSVNICLLLPFCIMIFMLKRNAAWSKLLSLSAILCSIYVVIYVGSRTACVLLLLLLLTLITRFTGIIRMFLLTGIVGLSMVFSYYMDAKKNSLEGRRCVYECTLELIKQKPLFGYGINSFKKTYMLKQAEFLHRKKDCKYAMLADDMGHPLSEVLLITLDFGLIGLVIYFFLFVLVQWFLFRMNDVFSFVLLLSSLLVLMSSLVFYTYKYPLPYLLCFLSLYRVIASSWGGGIKVQVVCRKIIFVFLLLLGTLVFRALYYDRAWYAAFLKSLNGNMAESLLEYEKIRDYYKCNPYYIYNYASTLFYAGDLGKAQEYGLQCFKIWPSYYTALLLGDVLYRCRDYGHAMSYYMLSHRMCPNRLVPLKCMMDVYIEMKEFNRADSVATTIIEKRIKISNVHAYEIKQEAYRYKERVKMAVCDGSR